MHRGERGPWSGDDAVWAAYDRLANAYLVKPHDMKDLEPLLRALVDFWLRVARPPELPVHPVKL